MKCWTVKALSEQWGCSRRHIYAMIDDGRLKAFAIGPRTMRITDEERQRCERQLVTSTDAETLGSAGAEQRLLQTIETRLASAAARS